MHDVKKKSVMVYLDPEIVKEAREMGLNLSRVCENALREAVEQLRPMYLKRRLSECKMAGPPGLEPGASGSGGQQGCVRGPHDLRMENCKNGRIFEDFRNFLIVDRQLEEGTVERHLVELRRLFESSDFNPLEATREDIRRYLLKFRDLPPSSYANILKALRVFYRDYLGKPEVIQGFKFPCKTYKLVKVPSRKELKEFYSWLKEPQAKAMFLIYATTGLRRKEVLSLKIGDIDFERRMIIPRGGSRTKRTWVTFYNHEAEEALREYLGSFSNLKREKKLFPFGEHYFRNRCKQFEKERGVKITPQVLREWFACEMGRLGVPDRYVDAFCGRVPRSVLAKHYTDFSPEKLKEIYEKANLKVLS